MTLCRVQVTDFRCLHQGALELDPQLTLVSGPNASGKTSVLEALYFLGRGRSFRTRKSNVLIRAGAEHLLVVGELDQAGRRVSLGVEASADGVRARMGGESVKSLVALALALPVQIIDPEVHRLIEEGPAQRRRFLDWGVFHVEPGFVAQWQQYHHVLRQRNAALRARQPKPLVSAWDGDLTRYADWLTAARTRYVRLLAPAVAQIAGRLLGLTVDLEYRAGWPRELDFAEALRRSWARDQELGVTQVGPQRAELIILVERAPARDRISRGQQKLLAAALLLAQFRLFRPEGPARPLLLLDDPAAELDTEHLEALIGEVRGEPLQLVVTSLAREQGPLDSLGIPGRHYRLDAGRVIPD